MPSITRVIGTLAHAVRDPIEGKLPLVKVPTLVTRGAKEPIVPMAWAQAATRLLPHGALAIVPDSPHNANYGAADQLAELVLAFLRRELPARDVRDRAPTRRSRMEPALGPVPMITGAGHHGRQAAAAARTVGRRRMDRPGRSCPLAYRYRPEALAQPAQVEADIVYVVGGLYGNRAALQAVLERAGRELGTPVIVFNGDFHWLDVDPEDFRAISETVLAHQASQGNVEAELASDEDAGCGCAYPDYVGDDVVDRSNQIMTRLRATATRFPELVGRLGALPRYLTARVAGERVGIVHGDPESLAGWRLALEAMEPSDPRVRHEVGWRGQPTTPAELLDWFHRADVSVFASTHTGLPYAQAVGEGRRSRLVINNGAAGLSNFAGTTHGVLTRLSSDPEPPPDSLYGVTVAALRCDALPVHFDQQRWQERFLAQWPPGSPGHRSYFTRITRGTHLRPDQAARGGVRLTAGR